MTVKVQAQVGEPMRGIRPVDPTRDMLAIVELVALGFEDELDPQGQKMLAEMRQAARHRTLSALTMGVDLDPVGFVWVEDGCVVGNLSLRYALPGRTKGQLIGNVVVHPDYRGMGIGRALVEAAIQAVHHQDTRWIGLEVRENNPVACGLYTQMGFEKVGRQQHLLRPAHAPWPNVAPSRLPWRVSKPKDRLLWTQLADAIYARRQKWVLEVRPGQYTFGGLERRFNRWLDGEREEAWLYGAEEARLAVCVRTDKRSQFHLWDILVHPDEGAAGAQAVVAQALQATRRFPAWPVIALVADQAPLVQALFDVGFKLHRSLVQMVMEL
ncbi:MAG TPA: GNAT family N-acetyltransferase [Anaerolineae bacterium]|nr:GNAT family N-acetyltransferase [Anaerolineae bacterium]HQI87058.1 GNAT family N-acetyltransferase [Anaerolineae bacterium]